MDNHSGAGAGAQVQQQPVKFSRYRSVRQAAATEQTLAGAGAAAAAANAPNAPTPNETIAKSMSRYRRAKPTTQTPVSPLQSISRPTQWPVIPRSQSQGTESSQTGGVGVSGRDGQRSAGVAAGVSTSTHPSMRQVSGASGQTSKTGATEVAVVREKHRQDAMERLTGGEAKTATSLSNQPTSAAENKGSGRLQKRADASGPVHSTELALKPQSPSTETKRRSWKDMVGLSRPKPSDAETLPTTLPGAGIDAPVSAVNAGERRVLVQYGNASIRLPVTPSTRAQDLLHSAANCLGREINPRTFTLVESFSELGLERPLRRYEHIRDVMNSWIQDEENSLLVVAPSSPDGLSELEISCVPAEPASDATVLIYHSQRPGKWDKRYVTLRSDGQMTVSKKEGGLEQTNICHLSDFDVYSPTLRYLSKRIKPPKRYCYAVKSQQKSSMFLSTENFVHFFSSSDRDTIAKWQRAVQQWRSWYLVHKLGAGHKKDTDDSRSANSATRKVSGHQRNVSTASTPYQLGTFKPLVDLESFDNYSIEEGPAECQDHAETQPSSPSSQGGVARKTTRERQRPPPAAFLQKLAVDTKLGGSHVDDGGTVLQGMSANGMAAATFAPTGLLGRTYSQRQRSMREREDREWRDKNPPDGSSDPFARQGLLGRVNSKTSPTSAYPHSSNPASHSNSRTNTMRSAHGPDAGVGDAPVPCSNSAQQPKPLVDLTPVFQEPPQHIRKGRGVALGPGVPLVEAATGRELGSGIIDVPSATTWKRPPATGSIRSQHRDSSNDGGGGSSRRNRTRSNTNHSGPGPGRQLSQQHYKKPTSSPGSPHDSVNVNSPSDGPFAPHSLLARSAKITGSQGGHFTGHGVATGHRNAVQPLLDMSPDSPFVEGSLLRDL